MREVGSDIGSIPPPWTDIGRARPCNPYQDGWYHFTMIEHMGVSNPDYQPKKEIPPPLSIQVALRRVLGPPVLPDAILKYI